MNDAVKGSVERTGVLFQTAFAVQPEYWLVSVNTLLEIIGVKYPFVFVVQPVPDPPKPEIVTFELTGVVAEFRSTISPCAVSRTAPGVWIFVTFMSP